MNNEINIIEKLKLKNSPEEIFAAFKEENYCIVLDSSLHGNELGRYAIIVFDPFLIFKSKGQDIKIIEDNETVRTIGDPLQILKSLIKKYSINGQNDEIPFSSGCVGYLSFDLCRTIEQLPNTAKDKLKLYDIVMGFYNTAVILDYQNDVIHISVSSAGLPEGLKDSDYLKKKIGKIKSVLENLWTPSASDNTFGKIKNIVEYTGSLQNTIPLPSSIKSNFTKEDYCNMVEEAKGYIGNGDIFQVNLSQQFRVKTTQEPFEIFKKLRKISPSPFSAYLDLEEIQIISNSPERFLKINGREIETRPIKGTRPRGASIKEDLALKMELSKSEKDKAELTMIVDVHRNDLGRVCKIGTVNVEKEVKIEEYANVFHSVATISGELKDDIDMIDCIRAAFPGGSITGAPKIRSMEIIEELEGIKRGIYTGAIGYIDFNGDSDFNIAIRTIVMKDQEAFYNVGGGIVWDSVPEKEYQETMDKGKSLLEALTCN